MKIVSYSTAMVGNPWKNWLFLRLETDEGTFGVGEASLNGLQRTIETSLSELEGYFLDKSPFQVNPIARDMLIGVYADGGQIHRSAIAAVDAACWDIVGKALDQPLWNLWGGRVRDQIPMYANGWYQTERDPGSFAASAVEVVARGYNAMKFDPFGTARAGLSSKEYRLSLDIVKAVRDAVPTEVDLMIEGHCRLDVPTALAFANDLADVGVAWFEEPVHFQNLAGLVEVARRSPVRIATGENLTFFSSFIELCQGSQNFVLQPDIANLGGLKAARQVCELGESLEMPVAPHDAQGPISKALCLQLCAVSPAVIIQEDFEEYNAGWTRTLSSPIEKRDGQAKIPEGPGLGRTLEWEKLAEHPYVPAAVLSLYEEGWERRAGGLTKPE